MMILLKVIFFILQMQFIMSQTSSSTSPPTTTCEECQGGLTKLVLEYDPSIYNVNCDGYVHDSGGDNCIVNDKGIVTFGNGINKLDNNVFLEISKDNDIWPWRTFIDTSCSQSIGPGVEFGPLSIVEAKSLNGGNVCRVKSKRKMEVQSYFSAADRQLSHVIGYIMITLTVIGLSVFVSCQIFRIFQMRRRCKKTWKHETMEIKFLQQPEVAV